MHFGEFLKVFDSIGNSPTQFGQIYGISEKFCAHMMELATRMYIFLSNFGHIFAV